MKGLKKVKIGVRLMIAFLIIAIIAGAIGIVGIINIQTVDRGSGKLYQVNVNNLAKVSSVSVIYQKIRFSALDMGTNSNSDEIKNDIKNISQFIAEADQLLDSYSTSSDGEKIIFTSLLAQWTQYKEYIKEATEYTENGQTTEAQDLILGDARKAGTALQVSFSEMLDFNINEAAKQAKANSDTAYSSMILMIGLLSAGVLIAVLLGILLTRSITRPVNATAKQLARMANGEELEPVNVDKFSGEFRLMIENLNRVRDALYRLLGDSHMLSDAAAKGALSTRADASLHQGGYRQIIEGINNTLDAVIAPINETAEALSLLSDGNLNVAITSEFAGDYAIIKNALNGTANSLKAYIVEISDVLRSMANGDLCTEIRSEFKGDFIALKDSINEIVDSMNTVMGDIHTAAEQVASGTTQVSAGSQTISQGAAEQAGSIEELSTSVTQIAAQTKQNAQSAGHANDLANKAKNDASNGNGQMKAMQQAMSEINDSSVNISRIIKVIDDIAFQTNILALNAAVEAARAGAHGKGFAVVAEEVRNLAARSAKAAKETTDLIEGSMRKVEAGTHIADNTASALVNILTRVEEAADLVAGIAVASNEQATAIAQVNSGIEQLSMVVQTNSATAEEAAAASEELSSQAELLKSMVARFRLRTGSVAVKADAKLAPQTEGYQADPVKAILSDNEFGKY